MKQSTFFNQLTAMPKRLATATISTLLSYKRYYLLLTILLFVGVGNVWGAEEIYKTALFGTAYNSKSVSSYTDSWSATNDGFTVNLTNANNNSNGWSHIKFGRKNAASTGTITTADAIDKAITKVTLTIDALTASKINSITLYTSTSGSLYTSAGTFTKATGAQTVTLSNPTPNLFYKIEVDCASGSSNGLITISKVDYYADLTPAATYNVSWVVNDEEVEETKGISEGSKVSSLPDDPEIDCSGKTFVGWSNKEVTDGNKPAVLFTDAANSPTITNHTTFYAVFAESGGSSVSSWSKTDIANINDGDEVVVVMNNGEDYALYDKNGTSSAPTATPITVSNNQIASPSSELIWVVGKSGDNLTFYQDDTKKAWLYCTSTNNGVRVGTNDNKIFTIDATSGYLKHTGTSRYVGIYNSQDWRCYTSTTSNIAGQTLAFYKKTTTGGYQNYTTSCTAPSYFTVTFNTNGHGTAPEAQTVTSGEYAQEPDDDPTETGYNFQDWYDNENCTGEPFDFASTPISADITLYAKWVAIQNTITLNANGGSGNTKSVTATYDSSTLNPSSITNPSKEGHTFGGWYSGEGGTGSLVINTSGKLQANVSGYTGTNGVWKATTNKTLYAKWTPSVYTITYKDQGNTTFSGTHESGNPTQHTYGTETTLKGASKTGYTFGGWYKEAECTNKVTSLGATEYTANITLYAQWTANTYTVKFDGNGSDGGSMANQSFTYGQSQALSANAFTRADYAFKHWTINQDGTGTSYTDKQSVSNLTATNGATVTLYAQWTPIYTITWLANGQPHYTQTAVEGTALEMPSAPDVNDYDACKDKVFVGWTETPIVNSTNTQPADLFTSKSGTLTANKTYYAVFATAEGTPSTDYEKITDINDLADGNYVIAYSYDGGTQVVLKNTTKNATQMDGTNLSLSSGIYANPEAAYIWQLTAQSDGSYYIYNSTANKYLSATTSALQLSDSPTKYNISYDSSNSRWTVVLKDNSTYYMHGYVSGSSYDFRVSTSGSGNKYRVYFYKNTSTVTYSDYVTTCVKLPDPVLSFVTTPADPIVFDPVNCGSTTTKAQAKTVQVSGANLKDVVSVEVTGPYKIARTSSTNLSDYTTSLTLDITATGAINANYSTIYIISCPPAQSTDATTGTLTFTTKKGNTLTVNLSTPTINCTTYALTFNDRGNKTVENYYAGVEVPQPEDPTSVCTEPIHYVFDGWAEATVANGSTEYTKVTFPYTMPGQNKTLYAVYRYLSTGGNGDYNLVTSALDDWSGDYLIAYNDKTFADGRIGGKEASGSIGETGVKVDLSSYISNNTIPATEGDKYYVTLEAVQVGYVLKTQDGKYNYHTNNTGNGVSASTISFAQKYPINVNFVSQEEVNLCLTGDALGSVFRYNDNGSGFFRFYKNGGMQPVYLYKKSTGTTLYTTSPICGAYVEITSDKDIYVTGGKGVHSTVVAQKTITFSATRLQPNASGNAPSIKVPAADITINGTPTTNVSLAITQDLTLQGDGTYAGTGEITISYTPTAYNITEDINVQLRAEYNTGSDVTLDAFTIHARSLPQEFVIVAKQSDKWYALNGDMSNGSSANPANGHVVVDDNNEPTKATYAPCNTIYTFDGLPNTGDRKFVRFQGTDGAWLWAASGTNVGIQNKSLKNTPSGNMEESKPYNWEIETENNITYFFHNANSSRVLRLNDGKFGMYVSGTDVIRILPYEAKCLYNYAPSNLKVSELKSTYVTLVWDAVAGATKYQYSTDATNWTDAGSEPTVTINGLTRETNYTYYIRAYHADSGVSQECFDYSEVTFTTANCDDVPTDIIYTADLNSITVSWTASATTATVKLYSDEAGTTTIQTQDGKSSPYKFTGLTKNTTYYVQILAGGTCASPIIPVKTENVKVDIVEWQPQGIVVDINTNEKVGVTLENEVSYGSGTGSEATELFFSKYYEATTNVKLVAIYNGTKNLIDLTDYQIHYGKDSWESQYITLKDFGATKGQIQPGEEIILYTMSDNDDSDKKIMDCVNGDYPDGKWVRVTQSNNEGKGHLSFAGNKTLVLKKAGTIIDIIGALDSTGKPTSKNANSKPSWGDANGWNCATGLSIADDTEIGISTNRCLLIRNNTVTSGANAVTSNIDNFVTLCSEWKGAQVPDSDVDNGVAASCENFTYVGTFDYSDYYTKYESMGKEIVFEENVRNADGTVNVPITDLYKQSCRNIRITLEDKDGNVLSNREYKVPIMITTTQGTDGEAFIALQENLAMIETDGEGNVVATHPLSLEEVREICKTCDVVIRDNATLMKMDDDAANDHSQVHDVYVYENSSLVVPNGTNYTINNLSLRRKGDEVASLNVYPGALKLPESVAAPISLDVRVDAQNWHWFTLPYNCNISEVTWIDGSPAQYNADWFLMTYDGESRSKEQSHYENHWKQYFGTTIEAGKGYIVGITGDLENPAFTYELRFPMAKEVLENENKDKTVDVRAWGVEDDIRPNKKGWNLIGNPYLAYYQRDNVNSFGGLRLGELIGPDSQTGLWEQTGNLPYVVVPVEGGWVSYEQLLVSETDLLPFTAYFVQVGNDGTHTSEEELSISFDHTKLQLSATPMPASIIQRSASEIDEVEEPVIVGVTLSNSLGESDKTSLVIDKQYTDEYEMNADFFKWFGDYYTYYTKPVLYTIGADKEKRAFNALSKELANQPIAMGMYAAKAGEYTFTLDLRSDLSRVEEVWLHDATENIYTNLLQDSYTFSTSKVNGEGRFFLSVKMKPAQEPEPDPTPDPDPTPEPDPTPDPEPDPNQGTNLDNIATNQVWATVKDNVIYVNGLLSSAQLWIYDAAGKLLHQDQTQYYQHTYIVPQGGAYFVRVQSTMQTQTIKVVVK